MVSEATLRHTQGRSCAILSASRPLLSRQWVSLFPISLCVPSWPLWLSVLFTFR